MPAVEEHAERAPPLPSSFPLGLNLNSCLFVAGSAAALSTYVTFRLKATKAFKVSYITTWLTLGPAAVLYMQPDREALEKKLRASRGDIVLPSAEVREAQIRALRGTSQDAKE